VALNLRLTTITAALAILLASNAGAQNYPNKNITVMCGFAAGGGADLVCRFIAEKLSPLVGQRVIVENKVGAQGAIAADTVARARPDGYTLLVTPAGATHSMHPYQFAKPLYDPINDFTIVTTIARTSFVVLVHPDKLPVKTIGELTAWTKANKSKTGGSTVTAFVASELYKYMAGIDMLQVPYKSAQTAVLDLLAGELDFVFCDPGLAKQHLNNGVVRGLAVSTLVPSEAYAELPTLDASGFPGFDVGAWWGAFLPPNVPEPILRQMRQWIEEIVLRDETKRFLHNSGIDVFPASDMNLLKFQQDELEKWKKLYAVAKVEPQ
jgi:tripartite-type tricarboxylate transporter receptor subunit TctC